MSNPNYKLDEQIGEFNIMKHIETGESVIHMREDSENNKVVFNARDGFEEVKRSDFYIFVDTELLNEDDEDSKQWYVWENCKKVMGSTLLATFPHEPSKEMMLLLAKENL